MQMLEIRDRAIMPAFESHDLEACFTQLSGQDAAGPADPHDDHVYCRKAHGRPPPVASAQCWYAGVADSPCRCNGRYSGQCDVRDAPREGRTAMDVSLYGCVLVWM